MFVIQKSVHKIATIQILLNKMEPDLLREADAFSGSGCSVTSEATHFVKNKFIVSKVFPT